jgi:hypothetical protein
MIEIKNFRPLRWFGINGMVLYPFVLYADRDPSRHIKNHERIHVEQIRRDGVLSFYGHYLLEYLRSRKKGHTHHESYMRISYEREAYAHERDFAYSPSASLANEKA